MALSCERCVDLFGAYEECALAPRLRGDVEDHLSGCPSCRETLDGYRGVPGLVRRATEGVMPAAAQGRLRRRLGQLWRRGAR